MACNSLLRRPELKAMRNSVLTARFDKLMVSRGSKGGFLKASSTRAKFHVGMYLLAGGFCWKNDLINSLTTALSTMVLLPTEDQVEEMTDL